MPADPDDTPRRAEIAARLHRLAIHLLRRVRREDPTSGLSAARLSALSVVVHAGPISLGDLAREEQVRPPTMSRLVDALVDEGLVERNPDPTDARAVSIEATAEGLALLEEARLRRIERLVESLDALNAEEIHLLEESLGVLDRVFARPAPGKPSS